VQNESESTSERGKEFSHKKRTMSPQVWVSATAHFRDEYSSFGGIPNTAFGRKTH
jgi:hypothetical protein